MGNKNAKPREANGKRRQLRPPASAKPAIVDALPEDPLMESASAPRIDSQVRNPAKTTDKQTSASIADETEPPSNPLETLARDFELNIAAVRHFSEQIGAFADAQDRKRVLEFVKAMFGTLSIKIDVVQDGVDFSYSDDAASDKRSFVEGEQEQLKQYVHAKLAIPEVKDRLFAEIGKFKPSEARSGMLLRRSTLLTLVSYVDVLVARLVRIYYKKYPTALPATTRLLSLADLREIGSVEAAEEYILDRRVDLLLRKSLKKQLEFFTGKLKLNLDALNPFMDRIWETVQRRHILVHNGGVVNRSFLERVSPSLVAEYKLKNGGDVDVDEPYLRRAIDRVHYLGVVLLQRCWRHWYKDDAANADSSMNGAVYEAIVERRYTLARHLGEFAVGLTYKEDASRRSMILNLAQAYKWDGEHDRAVDLIAKTDWSSCSLRFKLAVHAIRDEFDKFFGVLPLAVVANEVSRVNLEEWPILQKVRQDPRFNAVMASLYPSGAMTPATRSESLPGGKKANRRRR